MFSLFNLKLSLKKLMKMNGNFVYIFSERTWAKIFTGESYPLLIFADGNSMSWEDWLDVQTGGIYVRPPILKLLFTKLAERTTEK